MNKIFTGMIQSVLMGLLALTPLSVVSAGETFEQAVDRIVKQGAEANTELPHFVVKEEEHDRWHWMDTAWI